MEKREEKFYESLIRGIFGLNWREKVTFSDDIKESVEQALANLTERERWIVYAVYRDRLLFKALQLVRRPENSSEIRRCLAENAKIPETVTLDPDEQMKKDYYKLLLKSVFRCEEDEIHFSDDLKDIVDEMLEDFPEDYYRVLYEYCHNRIFFRAMRKLRHPSKFRPIREHITVSEWTPEDKYDLTIKDGVITDIKWLRDVTDANGEKSIEEIKGSLYIPKEVTDIALNDQIFYENLVGFSPKYIVVEEGNETFSSNGFGLIRNSDGTLLLACGDGRMVDNGSLKTIGTNAYGRVESMIADYWNIPEGVEHISQGAFASYCEGDIHFRVPESVKKVDTMAFMMRLGNSDDKEKHYCTVLFDGDPEFEIGVFGTKAESYDSSWQLYKEMPDAVYTNPESFFVFGKKGGKVEAYCNKYGIPFQEE